MTPADASSGSTSPSDSSGSTTSGVEPSTSSSTDGADESTEETGFDPTPPMCGNGFVEEGEGCDDGNRVDDDGCSNVCTVPCGLEWSTLTLGPTLDSEIEGRTIERDANDQILVSGRLREITVGMDGTVTEGDDTVLAQSYDPTGGLVWEQILGTPEGDARPGGLAVDAAGDVYVAATLDAADGGTAIRVVKLAAADGAEVWSHDYDGPFPGEDERATGLAVGPDGQPVVSGEVRAGDGDDDAWVRKLDAADGSEVWTESYSGVGTGMFSTDDGGPVAIASDGAIYVLAGLYEDFQTTRGTVLRYEAGGGPPTWTFTPEIDALPNQSFGLTSLAVAGDDGPVMTIFRSGGTDVNFWVIHLDAAGSELWTRTHEDFVVAGAGTDWFVEDVAANGEELVVLGRYFNDQTDRGAAWWEAWVARLEPDGRTRCETLHGRPSDGFISPSLLPYAVTTSSSGSALVTGEVISTDEAGLWLGSFSG